MDEIVIVRSRVKNAPETQTLVSRRVSREYWQE